MGASVCRYEYTRGKMFIGQMHMLERQIQVRSIKLTLTGECRVKWKVDSGGDDEKTYKSHEVYFVRHIFLYGQENSQQDVSITPGLYNSPFQYQLPTAIPSKFVSKYGTVSYTIAVSVESSGVFASDEANTFVMDVYNPTSPPAPLRPIRLFGEGEDTGCFGGLEMIKFELTTDKNYYSPGESILVDGYVMNGSSVATEKVRMSLVQHLTVYGRRSDFSFTSSGNLKSKEKKYLVAQWDCENVRPRGTVNLVNRRSIAIPGIPESDLKHCQSIDVKYSLQFEVLLSGWCSMTIISNPVAIFIGNNQQPQHQSGVTPSAPAADAYTLHDQGDMSSAAPGYETLSPPGPKEPPPPNYDDAIKYGSAVTTSNADSKPSAPPSADTPNMGTYYDWSQSAFTYK
uniref:arrestin domain-containing protein 2-like n=1 Tax=Styela clava TaxID=7725 RepID=UPI00193ACEA4|nr:arrestin domain-containing protein 2-like [Styela clava]